MSIELVQTLNHLHEQVLTTIGRWNETDAKRQWHPDLSPALWHLGHVAVVESYWLREVVLGEALPDAWPALYLPERLPKHLRAAALPRKEEVFAFASILFREHVCLLSELMNKPARHPLLRDAYLAHFLVQHCAQHRETLAQIAQQRLLSQNIDFTVTQELRAREPQLPSLDFPAGFAHLGNSGEPAAYDNELPRHNVPHLRFRLGEKAVTNAEYLGFMQSGGYKNATYWTDAGWRWRARKQIEAPAHWRLDGNARWYAIESDGPAHLVAEGPASGLSHYEAEAFARYCGCRLPSETEWEHAQACGAIDCNASVWEWCSNVFYPYPGYRSFPYPRYSQPWFDGHHFALRGASRHTHASVRRGTFRNFFTADKRHIFAGARLVTGAKHV